MICCFFTRWVVNTSASAWLETFVSDMTYKVWMGTLNTTHSLSHSLEKNHSMFFSNILTAYYTDTQGCSRKFLFAGTLFPPSPFPYFPLPSLPSSLSIPFPLLPPPHRSLPILCPPHQPSPPFPTLPPLPSSRASVLPNTVEQVPRSPTPCPSLSPPLSSPFPSFPLPFLPLPSLSLPLEVGPPYRG